MTLVCGKNYLPGPSLPRPPPPPRSCRRLHARQPSTLQGKLVEGRATEKARGAPSRTMRRRNHDQPTTVTLAPDPLFDCTARRRDPLRILYKHCDRHRKDGRTAGSPTAPSRNASLQPRTTLPKPTSNEVASASASASASGVDNKLSERARRSAPSRKPFPFPAPIPSPTKARAST